VTIIRTVLALGFIVVLSACGGGGSTPVPHASAPTGGSTVPTMGNVGTVNATGVVSSGLAAAQSIGRRLASLRTAKNLTIATVQASGAIYPSYGGATIVTNTQTLTPTNNQVTINLSFSNVPVANNAWMAVHLLATASDGSQFDLGWLGAIVNVTAGQVSAVNLGVASTQFYQVFTSLVNQGLFSSVDLANPAFAATLATQIAAAATSPDPTTQLYTPTSLNTIATSVQARYLRRFTVNSGQNNVNARISVLADYTNAAEIRLGTNIARANCTSPNCALPTFPAPTISVGPNDRPAFFKGTTTIGLNVPSPATPQGVTAYTQSASNATFVNMYDGPTLIGAFSGGAPFTGGWTSIPSIAGDSPTITVASVPTQKSLTIIDPQTFAFTQLPICGPGSSYCLYSVKPDPNALSPYVRTSFNWLGGFYAIVPTNFSATSSTVLVSTWNPVDLPISAMDFCANTQTDANCTSIASLGDTLSIQREFEDPGYNPSYYNWQPGPGLSSIAPASCSGTTQGLQLKSNGASSGSFSTTTPTYLGRTGSRVGVSLYGGNGCQNQPTLVTGATWTISVIDNDGNVYTGSSDAALNLNGVAIPINGLTKTVEIVKMTITYTMPIGVTPPAIIIISDMRQYEN